MVKGRIVVSLLLAVALGSLVSLAEDPKKPAPAVGSAHKAVGAEKCKMCHKLQYDSWLGSKHAALKEKVECETCHGAGADYLSMGVMKDPAKSKAAGLVIPGKEFCTAKCHHPAQWKDDLCQKVHAHKPKPGEAAKATPASATKVPPPAGK